jgi:hypothetical protein
VAINNTIILPSFSPIFISNIILLHSILALNAINISFWGWIPTRVFLYSPLFHVSLIYKLMDCFINLIMSLIFLYRHLIIKKYNHSKSLQNKYN